MKPSTRQALEDVFAGVSLIATLVALFFLLALLSV